MKLYRIILPVPDIEKAAAFYSKIFGENGSRVSPGRHYFDLEGTILALYDPLVDGDEIKQQWAFHENQYIYISTDNIQMVHEHLINSGCRHVDKTIEKMPWGERLFYANDPFGNPICFVERGSEFTG